MIPVLIKTELRKASENELKLKQKGSSGPLPFSEVTI